jgi:hypothetical protein
MPPCYSRPLCASCQAYAGPTAFTAVDFSSVSDALQSGRQHITEAMKGLYKKAADALQTVVDTADSYSESLFSVKVSEIVSNFMKVILKIAAMLLTLDAAFTLLSVTFNFMKKVVSAISERQLEAAGFEVRSAQRLLAAPHPRLSLLPSHLAPSHR